MMLRKRPNELTPVKLIAEVKKRPGLYRTRNPAGREAKLKLWKEVGAAIYRDWQSFNKATVSMKVVQMQKEWDSLRDAYNREVNSARRSTRRSPRRVYVYQDLMSFLGGQEMDSEIDCEEETQTMKQEIEDDHYEAGGPSNSTPRTTPTIRTINESDSEDDNPPEEVQTRVVSVNMSEGDSDRLFLMSFLPAIKQLPAHINIWMRVQITNVMQEALNSHLHNTYPLTRDSMSFLDF